MTTMPIKSYVIYPKIYKEENYYLFITSKKKLE